MKVLLVGGSGLVGTVIAPYLAERHELRVLDPSPPRHELDWVQGSATSVEDLERALDGVDAFVNLTMKSGQGGLDTDQTPQEITDNYSVNLLGLHLLLHTAQRLGIRSGVQTSSMSVHYRARSRFPSEEGVPLDSPSVYGMTKGLSEQVCAYFSQWFGMSLVALRITTPRGREQWRIERRDPQVVDGVCRLFPTDEEDLATAYMSALDLVAAGHPRFDAIYIAGDEHEAEHNLTKARWLLGWTPQSHLRHEEPV